MRLCFLAGVLAFVLGTAACGPGSDDANALPTGDTRNTVRGGTLVVALTTDPGHLNPAITTSGATHTAAKLLYNGLVELGPDLEPVPELATEWDVEEGGTLYRFYLREGVTWHDAMPFTSADVKFSFEEVLLRFHSRTRASLGSVLESIETPDDHTVEFRFREPYAPLLQQLNVLEAPMVPKHVYEGADPQQNPANLHPVGTGPFRFVSYTPDAEIRFAANSAYFKEGLPLLDEIVMRVIPDKGNQVIALEAGEVDWLFGVPAPDQARLRAVGDIEFLRGTVNPGGANCIMTVSFNLDRPMFQDVRMRRAIAHALDREQFLERVLFGEGRVADAPISSGIPFAHAKGLDMPSFNRAEAERLLDEAGWVQDGDGTRTANGVDGIEDGTPLTFNFLHFPSFSPYGELLRAQLREVGIDVTQRPLEPAVFVETVFRERRFDTNIISYCNSTDPEVGVRRMYISSNIAPVPFSNSSAYRNETVDRLFDEARSTVEVDERSRLYQQIQEILVQDLPYFWIVETVSTRAHHASCTGFKLYGHFADSVSCVR